MWPDFQQQRCIFPSPCILLMLFKAISPIGNENITPICLGSANLLIGPILLALRVFRDLMIIIGWWDEKGKIICWILSNTLTSVPSELRAVDDDNMVSQQCRGLGLKARMKHMVHLPYLFLLRCHQESLRRRMWRYWEEQSIGLGLAPTSSPCCSEGWSAGLLEMEFKARYERWQGLMSGNSYSGQNKANGKNMNEQQQVWSCGVWRRSRTQWGPWLSTSFFW